MYVYSIDELPPRRLDNLQHKLSRTSRRAALSDDRTSAVSSRWRDALVDPFGRSFSREKSSSEHIVHIEQCRSIAKSDRNATPFDDELSCWCTRHMLVSENNELKSVCQWSPRSHAIRRIKQIAQAARRTSETVELTSQFAEQRHTATTAPNFRRFESGDWIISAQRKWLCFRGKLRTNLSVYF